MIRLLIILTITLFATACANKSSVTQKFDTEGKPLSTTYEGVDPTYAYYADSSLRAQASQPPLFEMKAQPGQTIELKGVESLRINAPAGDAMRIAAPQRKPTFLEQTLGVVQAFTPIAQIAGNVYMNKENQETTRFITATNAERDTSLFTAFGTASATAVNALRDVGVAQAENPDVVTTTTTTTTISDSFNHTEDNDTAIRLDVSGAMLVDSDGNTIEQGEGDQLSPPTTTTNTDNSNDGDDDNDIVDPPGGAP